MNARLFFIAMLTGLLWSISGQCFAQSGASVNYTIVITEDMLFDQLNHNGGTFTSSDGFVRASTANVSIRRMQDGGTGEAVRAYQAEMNPSHSPELFESLGKEDGVYAEASGTSDQNEYGQYLVTMEFN